MIFPMMVNILLPKKRRNSGVLTEIIDAKKPKSMVLTISMHEDSLKPFQAL
jgi:hypothetical protein